MRRGETPSVAVQNGKKGDEEGNPSHHGQNKRKGDEGGTPTLQSKQREMQEGFPPPCHSQNGDEERGTRPVAVQNGRRGDEEKGNPFR